MLRTLCTTRGLSSQNQLLSPPNRKNLNPQNNDMDMENDAQPSSPYITGLLFTSRNKNHTATYNTTPNKNHSMIAADTTRIVEMDRNFIEESFDADGSFFRKNVPRQNSLSSHEY